MKTALRIIWQSTTENATYICTALFTLLFVSGKTLLAMGALTVLSFVLYYYGAIKANASHTSEESTPDATPAFDTRLFLRKIWRITVTNAIWIAMAFAAIYWVQGVFVTYTIIVTIVSYVLYYIYAYRTMEYVEIDYSALPPFSWRTFAKNMWEITTKNILTIVSVISLVLYVAGKALFVTTILVIVGLVFFYIDAYRAYLLPKDEESASDDESHEQAVITAPLSTEG